jgi:biotin-(acetyl-CoA carboxylase) ligase
MVKTKRNLIFSLIYILIKLSLLLPVATAKVEKVFSAMHIVKSRLRNRIRDKWMNDILVTLRKISSMRLIMKLLCSGFKI